MHPGFSLPVLQTEKMVNAPSRRKNENTPIATQISSSALSPFKKYTRGKVTKGRTRKTSMTNGRICKDKKGGNKIQKKKITRTKGCFVCRSCNEKDDEQEEQIFWKRGYRLASFAAVVWDVAQDSPKLYRVSVAWHLKVLQTRLWTKRSEKKKHGKLRKLRIWDIRYLDGRLCGRSASSGSFNATLNKSVPWYIWIFLWNSLFVGL